MLGVEMFNAPTQQAYGMLNGQPQAAEKEVYLAWWLIESINDYDWTIRESPKYQDDFLSTGLIEKCDGGYKLTRKAKGLLYAYYGKE